MHASLTSVYYNDVSKTLLVKGPCSQSFLDIRSQKTQVDHVITFK